MQKAIAKYGLAAHLALLAVAPLVLFPYCGGATIATVVLWLSFSAACWTLLEPSVRKGEMLHDARRRVSLAIVRDPLFWTLLAVAVLVGLRALNTGISMFYDYETRGWVVSSPFFEMLPSALADSGYLPFAAAVATTVLVVACRHALGRSARMAFLLVGSLVAGLSAPAALYFAGNGNAVAKAAMECGVGWLFRPGAAFAIYLLCSTVAAFGAFERKWSRVIPVVMLAIAGNAAGLFAFSTPFEIVVFLGADLVLFLFVFICAWVSDTCAYFVGVKFGKHKLAPVLSPKKSIEGSVGGIVGTAIFSILYGLVLMYVTNMAASDLWICAVIGAVGSVFSQIGDLVASGIKRHYEVKDYGNLIPGHGGIMDRFDSVIVTAPLIYFLITLFL